MDTAEVVLGIYGWHGQARLAREGCLKPRANKFAHATRKFLLNDGMCVRGISRFFDKGRNNSREVSFRSMPTNLPRLWERVGVRGFHFFKSDLRQKHDSARHGHNSPNYGAI